MMPQIEKMKVLVVVIISTCIKNISQYVITTFVTPHRRVHCIFFLCDFLVKQEQGTDSCYSVNNVNIRNTFNQANTIFVVFYSMMLTLLFYINIIYQIYDASLIQTTRITTVF